MHTNHCSNPIHHSLLKLIGSLLFVITFAANSMAQLSYVNYYYDNNGNRTTEWVQIIAHSMVHHNDTIKNDSIAVMPIIKVYPNPTAAIVNVSISTLQNCEFATLYLSDASGNLISTKKTSSTLSQLNLTSYNPGLFYLKILMCDNQYSYKVIKLNPGRPFMPSTSAPPLVK
jgi:hypothetical protein